ncbi:MAG: hypothetical protein ACYS91_06425 [Planctomycetota bacterium]|jgi:hypothetical protein
MSNLISIRTRRYSTLLKRIFEEYNKNVEIIIDGIKYTEKDIPELLEWWCKNVIIKRTLNFTFKQDGVTLFGFHDTPDEFYADISERTFVERLAKETIIRCRIYPPAYGVFLRNKRKISASSFFLKYLYTPDVQVLIGKLGAIPIFFAVLFILNGSSGLTYFPTLEMTITAAILGSYAFLLGRNLLKASLAILSFITVQMIPISYGRPTLTAIVLLALFMLYQGIIGIYRIKSKQMNNKQQAVIWIWIAAAFVMGFYPPWLVAQGNNTDVIRYSPIWSPPSPGFLIIDGVHLNLGILDIQWLIISVVCISLMYILGDRKEKT